MFAFCTPEQSEAMHQELLAIEEEIFQGLGLPYHVIDTCTGDLGGPAYRKYDLEAWMPGRGEGGEYGEVTSTSELHRLPGPPAQHPLQADRARRGRGSSTRSTAPPSPCTRALVAILENYQQADGSVVVREVLRPWVGKDRIANNRWLWGPKRRNHRGTEAQRKHTEKRRSPAVKPTTSLGQLSLF